MSITEALGNNPRSIYILIYILIYPYLESLTRVEIETEDISNALLALSKGNISINRHVCIFHYLYI